MNPTSIPNRVKILKQKFTNSLGLSFRDLLPESTIREALNAENLSYRRRLFDPFVSEASGVALLPAELALLCGHFYHRF